MSPRTTGIVFLVAAGLFAFIWFYEIQGEEGRRQAEEAERQLFAGLEASRVEAVGLTTSDGVAVEAVRLEDGGGWELREPVVARGDPFALDALAAALADLRSETVYEEPQAREVYGLGEGARRVSFRADGEGHQVLVGGQTPVGTDVYVAVEGDERVYTVSSFTANALHKSLLDLRDKRVLDFETDSIARIEARWQGGHVVLARDAEGWHLVEPIEGPADGDTVDTLLTDLSFLRASGFEDDPPPDAEAGLAPPEWSAVLSGAADGEDVRVSVAIGASPDGSTRLVRGAGASLYRIPAERLADLPRELVAYRKKELARFAANEASRLELVFERRVSSEEGDQPLTIVATRGEEGWEARPERFKPGLLAGVVSELSRLRGSDILLEEASPEALPDLGLAPPHARLTVYGEGEEPLAQVRIGARRGDAGYAAMAEGGASVYLLDPALAEFVPTDLDAFRQRFRSEEQPLAGDGP